MLNQGSEDLRESLRILVRLLGLLEKNDASCCGVTTAQCHAIVEIGRAGRISLIDLADLLGLEKSTMSRTINNLVDAYMVTREIDFKNRRYVSIQLTDQGEKVFRSIEEGMKDYYNNIFNKIPESKRDQVLESLGLLMIAMKENK